MSHSCLLRVRTIMVMLSRKQTCSSHNKLLVPRAGLKPGCPFLLSWLLGCRFRPFWDKTETWFCTQLLSSKSLFTNNTKLKIFLLQQLDLIRMLQFHSYLRLYCLFSPLGSPSYWLQTLCASPVAIITRAVRGARLSWVRNKIHPPQLRWLIATWCNSILGYLFCIILLLPHFKFNNGNRKKPSLKFIAYL